MQKCVLVKISLIDLLNYGDDLHYISSIRTLDVQGP